ncbi:MAG: hypothetical protein AAF411_11470 [Myxococcota bacterium]
MAQRVLLAAGGGEETRAFATDLHAALRHTRECTLTLASNNGDLLERAWRLFQCLNTKEDASLIALGPESRVAAALWRGPCVWLPEHPRSLHQPKGQVVRRLSALPGSEEDRAQLLRLGIDGSRWSSALAAARSTVAFACSAHRRAARRLWQRALSNSAVIPWGLLRDDDAFAPPAPKGRSAELAEALGLVPEGNTEDREIPRVFVHVPRPLAPASRNCARAALRGWIPVGRADHSGGWVLTGGFIVSGPDLGPLEGAERDRAFADEHWLRALQAALDGPIDAALKGGQWKQRVEALQARVREHSLETGAKRLLRLLDSAPSAS